MTTINNITSGSYYSLSQQKTDETEEVKKTTSVASILNATSETSTIGAYNLDLSPEAQAYLKSMSQKTAALPAATGKDYGFTLTPAEQKQLDEIIAKYKDVEYTQENFNKMQEELKGARLDSLNMAAKSMVRNFSTTTSLMEALGGNATLIKATDRLGAMEKKSETYIDQIAKDWQKLIAENKEA